MELHVRDDLLRRLAALEISINDTRDFTRQDAALLELLSVVRALVKTVSGSD